VDDFIAEATPEDKIEVIQREQAEGKLVAMTGTARMMLQPLAQANVGVAMNTGTQAEAANMVDLDSDPKADRYRCNWQTIADYSGSVDDFFYCQ